MNGIPNLNYDIINNGLWEVTQNIEISIPQYTFLHKFLFGLEPIATSDDFIARQLLQRDIPALPTETMKYGDPDLENYDEQFSLKDIFPQYYFKEDSVNLSNVANRVSPNEPISAPWSYETRAVYILGQKARYKRAQFEATVEKLCSDMVLTGKYTTKANGDQESDTPSELLNLSVASTWSTNPIKALETAATSIFNQGGTMPRVLILNPADATPLITNSKIMTILDNRRMEMGGIKPTEINAEDGSSYIGRISLPSVGPVDIYTYAGQYKSKGTKHNFIPQGKAYFGIPNIGRIGYCGLIANIGGKPGKIAGEYRATAYDTSRGDLVTAKLQTQFSPAAIVTRPSSYGIITGIPAA